MLNALEVIVDCDIIISTVSSIVYESIWNRRSLENEKI